MTDGTTIKTIDYLDGFQYAGSVLQFFPHSEGYVKATPATPNNTGYYYNYVYNYTDHLGNVRLSYFKDLATGELKILEENHYYPFGLRHEVYGNGSKMDYKKSAAPHNGTVITYATQIPYQYKYNGKEWQDELGLGWYDYQARNYDPALGRWNVIDPMAPKYSSHSPYAYTLNNPVYFIDPTGMMVEMGDQLENGGPTGMTVEPPVGFNGEEFTDETGHYTKFGGLGYSYVKDGDTSKVFDSNDQFYYYTAEIIREGRDNGLVATALRAYEKNYDPRFSPYTPGAMSINLGASGNWYVANYDVSVSLIFSPGNISIGVNVGGGLGIDSDMPFKNISPFSPFASVGFHDTYGGQTNVIEGLRGWSTTATYSGGPFSISRSTSAIPFKPNGAFMPASKGVKSTYFGIAPCSANIGVNVVASYSKIWSLKNN